MRPSVLPNWFIAFPVRESLWLPTMLEGLPPGIRAFHPLDLHLTLAFLGPVTELQARQAWNEALKTPPSATFISFLHMEAFGGTRNPTAFSLTLQEGRASLIQVLNQQTRSVQQVAGARLETRPPRPHVTIARPSTKARGDRAVAEAARQWMETVRVPGEGLWLRELSLFTWAQARQTRLFEEVETLRLPA